VLFNHLLNISLLFSCILHIISESLLADSLLHLLLELSILPPTFVYKNTSTINNLVALVLLHSYIVINIINLRIQFHHK